eukprot:759086-Hanusia_phi.AAC.5
MRHIRQEPWRSCAMACDEARRHAGAGLRLEAHGPRCLQHHPCLLPRLLRDLSSCPCVLAVRSNAQKLFLRIRLRVSLPPLLLISSSPPTSEELDFVF